jgi:DNA-binding transcriptional ArsR family regulator
MDVVLGRAPEDDPLERCDETVVDCERVSVVRRELMSVDVAERIAAIFKILGDPGRCRLVAALIAAGELCVRDLATSVGMSVSNASHHLRVLRSHGLVRARRAGKMVYYSPDDAHVRVLLEITREHVRHGSA